MSKHGPARAVLAGAVIVALAGCALAGCSGVPAGTRPDVPSPGGHTASAAGSRSAADATSSGNATSSGASASGQVPGTSPPATQPGAPATGFARANSVPFPVAVGNTWVYQTSAGGQTGRTTNKIVGAGPGSAGYRVTVSSTTEVGGSVSTVTPVYTFYPDGTIGYPVPWASGMPVAGGSIRWPDVTRLASGQVYHSVLEVQGVSADVTVPGRRPGAGQRPGGLLPRQRGEDDRHRSWVNRPGDRLDRAGHRPGENRGGDPRAGRHRVHHERAAVLHQGGRRRGSR